MAHWLKKYLILCLLLAGIPLRALSIDTPKVLSLDTFKIDPHSITVSGFSAGGFMAMQFFMSHSPLIKGAGIFAGGAYGCALGSAYRARRICMQLPERVNINLLVQHTKKSIAAGKLPDLNHLNSKKIFLYTSANDPIVSPKASQKLYEYLDSLEPRTAIVFSNRHVFGHAFPYHRGKPCQEEEKAPKQCGFDGVKMMFEHLYGSLKEKSSSYQENFFSFQQTPFKEKGSYLRAIGYLYVPHACQGGKKICRLHIFLHGCAVTTNQIFQFIQATSYHDWAEANDIIVLYPVVAPSLLNVLGCWDWWGYTGQAYDTLDGPQIKSLYNMIRFILNR